VLGPSATPPTATGDYAIELEQLASMTRDHNFSSLQQYGGVSQLQTGFPYFTPFYHVNLFTLCVISSSIRPKGCQIC